MPKISVIMPVYNTEKYIQEAIESIKTYASIKTWKINFIDYNRQKIFFKFFIVYDGTIIQQNRWSNN